MGPFDIFSQRQKFGVHDRPHYIRIRVITGRVITRRDCISKTDNTPIVIVFQLRHICIKKCIAYFHALNFIIITGGIIIIRMLSYDYMNVKCLRVTLTDWTLYYII